MAFTFNHIEPGIIRCQNTGPISVEDSRQLRAFLKDFEGTLLYDLSGTPAKDSAQEILRVRAALPKTAFFGGPLPEFALKTLAGKDFYRHEVQHFDTEGAALDWLRGDKHTESAQAAA